MTRRLHRWAAALTATAAALALALPATATPIDLSTPALVAGGRSDVVVPPANARRLARLLPDARLALLPGGHAFLFGERARFAELVRRFLVS
jgi:pimeloyl-ACP methyl ester carboxylesterase